MSKKFKSWLTPEEFGPDSRLCVAFEMPIGSGQFTVKTVPAKMVSEIKMHSESVENTVFHEIRMTAAQDGDPYLPISNEHVLLGRFNTKKEADKALVCIQKAVGYGRLKSRRIEGVGFVAAGFIVASILFGLSSTLKTSEQASNDGFIPNNSYGSTYGGPVDNSGPPLSAYLEPGQTTETEQVEEPEPALYPDLSNGDIPSVAKALIENTSGVFQVGDGKPLAIVLSDPMCPSCKQTKELFEQTNIPYLVAPVGKLSPESIKTAVRILCANDRSSYYKASFDNKSMDVDKKERSELEVCADGLLRNNELFDKTLSKGVPTIIRYADKEIRKEGFSSSEDLKAWLVQK